MKYYTNVISDPDFTPYTYAVGFSTKCGPYEKEFDTYDEAIAAARKTAAKLREDVPVYSTDSIVKFPVEDYKVEKMV